MKKRYIWAGIALACLLGLLVELFFKKEWIALTIDVEVELDEGHYMQLLWSLFESECLSAALHLAASEEPRKLAFAALLGEALEAQAIEKEAEKSAPFMIDSAVSSDSPEDKSKGLENTEKYLGNHSNKYQEIKEKREKEGRQILSQETLDSWRKMALEKAAADDVWVFSMLTTFVSLAKSEVEGESAKALREQALLRWQQAEPDNLAPLLYQEELSASQLLEHSKNRHQFIEYNYPILRWMYQTLLQQMPNQRQELIAAQLFVLHGATVMPIFKPLPGACKKNPPQYHSADWHSCRSIAQALLKSSGASVVPRLYGTSILQTLAKDEAEKQIFDNDLAYFHWFLDRYKHMEKIRILEQNLKSLQDENINSEIQFMEDFLLQEGLPIKPDEESLKPYLETVRAKRRAKS